ncbi:WLM domain-containing protein [Pseudomassariella vexata]|uniref:WLM domain-domain-containing protein n=1 Tax=Pseudomassariella vexata TaxID=1141098 RepID=A0A1Y2DDF2_9PEZI|nr:WLM domain-containing protein [Pseudomassariella vexata]ORY57134.1 WLM domain-domain-containing protein [Pseudomassariella vexata]
MAEIDPLILSFSHLPDFPRAKSALHMLKKVASLVKPIMRARGWKVRQLTEFYPEQQNLLGLNVNAGHKICLRLRYASDRTLFLPMEQVVDTMLHELSHNIHGPHDAKFHALWNQLRDEHEALAMKGYTGEGFLSEGHRLGGRKIPMTEARRLARAAAEKRRTLGTGSGQRLGGAAPRPGQDIRQVIVDVVERRNKTLQGCASNNLSQNEIKEIADTASRNGFRTQAEEDAANEAAIAKALWELVQEDEKVKYGDSYVPATASNPTGSGGGIASGLREENQKKGQSSESQARPAELDQASENGNSPVPTAWNCEVCTLENPLNYLCCDACGTERSEAVTKGLIERSSKRRRTTIDLTKPNSNLKPARAAALPTRPGPADPNAPSQTKKHPAQSTWTCSFCGRVREKSWWSCDLCGKVKESS